MQYDRPWGYFEILYKDHNYKVKRIVVHGGKRLSLQSHQKRDELWMVVAGRGFVTLRTDYQDSTFRLQPFDTIDIERTDIHRISNEGFTDLVFIEIQTGECSEDDIKRFEDDFGRVEE